MQSFNFISGLPRSGSTLLAAILAQNPAIRAGATSPAAGMILKVIAEMSLAQNASFFDEARRSSVLRGVLGGYYYDVPESIVDTNRAWCSQLPLIAKLYPCAKVICCVRNLGWIINSFERLAARDPTRFSSIQGRTPSGSVYGRATALMDEKTGIVGQAYAALKEAWFGDHADRLIVIDYDRLVDNPRNTVYSLYERCGWDHFAHDFLQVEYSAPAFDEALGAPHLHEISGPVRRRTEKLSIPPDLFARYADSEFWRLPQQNVRGADVLKVA